MRKDKTYDIQDIVHAQSDAVTLSDLIFAPEASGPWTRAQDLTIMPFNSCDWLKICPTGNFACHIVVLKTVICYVGLHT